MAELDFLFGEPPGGKLSPNNDIDDAIRKLLKDAAGDVPLDMRAKCITVAINWEKVKHQITDKDQSFDPEAL